MAGLVSVVGLVVAVKTFMDARGSGTMVLGFILLMNMIAANSPVADEITELPASEYEAYQLRQEIRSVCDDNMAIHYS